MVHFTFGLRVGPNTVHTAADAACGGLLFSYSAGLGAGGARIWSRPIQNTSRQPMAVNAQSGNRATGKLPVFSRSTPITDVIAPVPRCASVLIAAIPAAAAAGGSVSSASAKNVPLIA